jgi:hypothetical protein
MQRKSVLSASLDHFHHILHFAGLDVSISTLVLTLFSILLGVIGILLNHYHVPEIWQFMGWLLALILYFILVKQVRDATDGE